MGSSTFYRSWSVTMVTYNIVTHCCITDFAAPFTVTKDASKSSCDEGSISMIESMGFTRSQAVNALQATVSYNNV